MPVGPRAQWRDTIDIRNVFMAVAMSGKEKMRNLVVTVLGVALTIVCADRARAASFKYKIIFPDNEEKTYLVRESLTAVTIPNSSYKCSVVLHEPTVIDGVKLTQGSFLCKIPGSGSKAFSPILMCDDRRADGTTFWLYENSKHWIVQLLCNSGS